MVFVCAQQARTGVDDVTKILADSFPSGFCKTREDFDAAIKMIQSINPRSLGRVLKEWTVCRHEVKGDFCFFFSPMLDCAVAIVFMYTYIYIERERERERESHTCSWGLLFFMFVCDSPSLDSG